MEGFIKAAKLFFNDSEYIWPLHYSTYYLGHVPKLDHLVSTDTFAKSTMHMCFMVNAHNDFHTAGICLMSRIWGMVQRDMARRRDEVMLLKRC
jgi:hypothetical protein